MAGVAELEHSVLTTTPFYIHIEMGCYIWADQNVFCVDISCEQMHRTALLKLHTKIMFALIINASVQTVDRIQRTK